MMPMLDLGGRSSRYLGLELMSLALYVVAAINHLFRAPR